MTTETKLCITCNRRRDTECSHVECPNRKPVTAQPVGSSCYTKDSKGEFANNYRRNAHLFDN